MLARIEISNYKSIASTSLLFGVENVIVGPNGAGKSNLLDAINFLRDAANDGLDHAVTKRHGIISIRRWSKTRPYNIVIKMEFVTAIGSGEYKITIASAGGEFSVLEEEGSWFGKLPFSRSPDEEPKLSTFKRPAKGPVEFSVPDDPFKDIPGAVMPASEMILSQFGQGGFSPYAFFFRQLHEQISSCGAYSIYPNKIREPQTISNSDVLADDGTNLASIIRQMRVTTFRGSRESLTSAIQQVIPIVSEIRIESAGGFFVPVFRVKETTDGYSHDLNMSQISDGTLRMLGMLTAFYQPKAPRRITLEEPEQMIHPGLLPILVDAARDYLDDGKKGRQCFFTTHSPNLLDMFDARNIIGAKFEDGVTKFNPISGRQLKLVRERLFTAGELLVAEGILA